MRVNSMEYNVFTVYSLRENTGVLIYNPRSRDEHRFLPPPIMGKEIINMY